MMELKAGIEQSAPATVAKRKESVSLKQAYQAALK